MPEPTQTPATPPAGTPPAGTPPATPPTGTDPKQPDNGGSSTLDLSKVSDEDFAKIFEDPRLYKHDRFKKLGEAKQKLAEVEAQKAQAEEADLIKKKEWETLATKKGDEAKSWQGKYETAVIDNAIMNEAAKNGVTDLDAAKLLIDRNAIKLDENGNAQGVAEAVKALITQRAYLVGGKPQNTSVGTGTNPPNPNTDFDFTMTQIADSKFYQEHRDAILLAQAQGRIKDDRPGAR